MEGISGGTPLLRALVSILKLQVPHIGTLVYLIAKQDVLSEQVLNSKIHPTGSLFSAFVVSM